MTKISEAICFATSVFDGKTRKGFDIPAIFHSLEVASIVETYTSDEDVVIAALLHDTIEDTDVSLEEIIEKFGKRVGYLVFSETENKYPGIPASQTWELRKNESLNKLRSSTDIGVKQLWLADKLSNMRSFYRMKKEFNEGMWKMFNQKDPLAHKKYYETILNEVSELSNCFAYQEFKYVIEKVFGGYKC